jgi:3-hydroxyisobutyrate dehydrogenase
MMSSEKKIAYLGMGIMGASMASNLARAGFTVKVWNRTEGKPGLKLAADAGASVSASIKDAVSDADIVMMCLTDVPDLEDVLLRDGGVLDNMKAAAVVIDFSTTGPACARKMFSEAAKKQIHFLDAPVSGGDVGAKNGTLTVMVGGDRNIFDLCLPAFQGVGKNIHYCGNSGSGQAVKLCNQILCAVNMLAVCESMKLAELLAIDPKLMIDVCGSGAAGSWALSNLGARIARGDLEPGFMIKDMRKDLRLVKEALAGAGVDFEACDLADQKFVDAVEAFPEDGERKGTQAMSVAYQS